MVPIVSFVGSSESGKTTLLESLIPLLRGKGYRVGTIKHGSHPVSLDEEGKDSWRHARAGAEVALVSTPSSLGVFRSLEREVSLEELAECYLSDMDLILAEGYKQERIPKIEVRRGPFDGSLLTGEGENLLAVVSDRPISVKVPVFSPDQPETLVDFLAERFLRKTRKEEVRLLIDGHLVPLNPFVEDLFRSLLLAMVAPLKGIGHFTRLSIRLDAPGDGDSKALPR
ncbi:MAG: molybdopterin-guanine dinucleotide biosynthesis protein B [candidate division NC10 bacterium]|nr:molybdopterin-guanine dinucleotide biosynthesis protein B [candidate division NC10 bacterium]